MPHTRRPETAGSPFVPQRAAGAQRAALQALGGERWTSTMAPKKKNPEPEPEKKLSRGDVDELIDDGTALVEERDWAPALAKLEAAAEGLEGFEEHMVMSRLCSKIGQCQLELRDVNGALRTFEKQLSSAVLKSTSVSGAPDNSSRSHFSAMTWPRWLRRAVRNRHRHAIEQVSRRWRGGRRDERAVKI